MSHINSWICKIFDNLPKINFLYTPYYINIRWENVMLGFFFNPELWNDGHRSTIRDQPFVEPPIRGSLLGYAWTAAAYLTTTFFPLTM